MVFNISKEFEIFIKNYFLSIFEPIEIGLLDSL